MSDINLDELKRDIRLLASKYEDRIDRTRRIYIEDRAIALRSKRDLEYDIKRTISTFLNVSYSSISFAGSAQLGLSVHKDKPFVLAESDLDVACISSAVFQEAWTDIVDSSRAFTDQTAFSGLSVREVSLFKDQILRRGMINVKFMPRSKFSKKLIEFQDALTRKYSDYFQSVSIAIYINEYSFCWKQDSALGELLGK